MDIAGTLERAKAESWSDAEIVERVKSGETALYEILMRRYNQRLYRVALAILRNDAEAEDVMQDAYVRAYQHLGQFRERAPFSAWLTRIAVNEALARRRSRARNEELDGMDTERGSSMRMVDTAPDPEERATRTELAQLLRRSGAGTAGRLPDRGDAARRGRNEHQPDRNGAGTDRGKRKGEAASRTCHDEGLAIGSSRLQRKEGFSIHGRAMRPRGARSI